MPPHRIRISCHSSDSGKQEALRQLWRGVTWAWSEHSILGSWLSWMCPTHACSDIKTESSPLIVKAVSSKISLTYGKQSGTLWCWAWTTLRKSSDHENQFVYADIKASRLVGWPNRNSRPLSLSLMTAEVKRPPNNFTQTPDASSVRTTPSV